MIILKIKIQLTCIEASDEGLEILAVNGREVWVSRVYATLHYEAINGNGSGIWNRVYNLITG